MCNGVSQTNLIQPYSVLCQCHIHSFIWHEAKNMPMSEGVKSSSGTVNRSLFISNICHDASLTA